MNHLRQAPGSKGGENHHAQQVQGIRSKEGGIGSGLAQGNRDLTGNLRQPAHSGAKASLAVQDAEDDGGNAGQHDDTLNEIIDGSGHITAQDDIDGSQDSHAHYTDTVGNIKGHAE